MYELVCRMLLNVLPCKALYNILQMITTFLLNGPIKYATAYQHRVMLFEESSVQSIPATNETSFQTTSNIPVQVSIKSTVQTPAIGIYCFVMILMISCATRPPRNAAELGRSAVGDRAL